MLSYCLYQLQNINMIVLLTFVLVLYTQTSSKPFKIGVQVLQRKPYQQIYDLYFKQYGEDFVGLGNSSKGNLTQSKQLMANGMNFNLRVVVAGINYSMSIDTASSNFIIKGDQTTGQPPIKYQSFLRAQERELQKVKFVSSTLVVFKQKLNISFSGYQFEKVVFVTANATNFNSAQGILGIGTPVKAKFRPTFMEKLLQLELISNYSYGVNLNMLQPNRSFISFGQPDPEYYDEEMKYYPIYLEEGFYMDFESVSFGTDQSFDLKQYKALLDTGATMLSFSNQFLDVMKEQFNVKGVNQCGYYTYALVRDFKILMCIIQDFEALPQIAFTIQGHQYVIKKEHYLRSCSLSPEQEKNRPPNQRQVYYCETYLKINSHKTLSLSFGSPFFSRYYTYFDLTSQKIGLAKNNENLTVEYVLQNSKFLILSKFKNVSRLEISQLEQLETNERYSVPHFSDYSSEDNQNQQNQVDQNLHQQQRIQPLTGRSKNSYSNHCHNKCKYCNHRCKQLPIHQPSSDEQQDYDEQYYQIQHDLINQELDQQQNEPDYLQEQTLADEGPFTFSPSEEQVGTYEQTQVQPTSGQTQEYEFGQNSEQEPEHEQQSMYGYGYWNPNLQDDQHVQQQNTNELQQEGTNAQQEQNQNMENSDGSLQQQDDNIEGQDEQPGQTTGQQEDESSQNPEQVGDESVPEQLQY